MPVRLRKVAVGARNRKGNGVWSYYPSDWLRMVRGEAPCQVIFGLGGLFRSGVRLPKQKTRLSILAGVIVVVVSREV
jgi:hypothetical protein